MPGLLRLVLAHQRRHDPEAAGGADRLRARVIGIRSWNRRQLLVEDADGTVQALVACEDRSSGRTDLELVAAADCPRRDETVDALAGWAVGITAGFARARRTSDIRLNTMCDERDAAQRALLERCGFAHVRTWDHMEIDVTSAVPHPRRDQDPPVRVRRIALHEDGLPVARDARAVHAMVEAGFEDHFNAFPETFPEFAQRTAAPGGWRWDMWWIAETLEDGRWVPAGGSVTTPLLGASGERIGTYVEYLGVRREARRHGIGTAVLDAVLEATARDGWERAALIVDSDSLTRADELYHHLGWQTMWRELTWQLPIDVG